MYMYVVLGYLYTLGPPTELESPVYVESCLCYQTLIFWYTYSEGRSFQNYCL